MVLIFVPTFINFYQAEMMKLPEIVCDDVSAFKSQKFQVNQIATILMNSFVVKNPMLNIIFSSDLSNSLKNRLLLRKKSSISMHI